MEENNFTLTDFLQMFCGISLITDNNSFNKNTLYDFMLKCKNNKKYVNLLSDFNSDTKEKYKDSLFELQRYGIIKGNKQYDSVIDININASVLYLIKDKIDYIDSMIKLFNEYGKYSQEMYERVISYYNDDFDIDNAVSTLKKIKINEKIK